jgi:hypothetical protein
MNDDNLASDYLPEPPTPTSNALPLGEFIILESLNKWNRASSKITRLIYLEEFFSLYAANLDIHLALIASISGHAS